MLPTRHTRLYPHSQSVGRRLWQILILLVLFLAGCAADNAVLSTLNGNAKRQLGNFDQSIQHYNHALALNPNLPEAYYNRGVAYYLRDDPDTAILDFDRAIALKQDWADAYFWRGAANLLLGDPGPAIQDLDKAIELDPNHVYAYHVRGLISYLMQNVEQAIADFDKFIELGPNMPDTYAGHQATFGSLAEGYYLRGLLFMKAEDHAQAIADFGMAIELNPGAPQAYLMRALAYEATDELELALQDYEQILLLPNVPERPQIMRKVEELTDDLPTRRDMLTDTVQVRETIPVTTTTVYTNPHFPWSIAYPSDWFLDDTDTGWVRIGRKDAVGLLGVCGVHSADLAFSSIDEFVDYIIDDSALYFQVRGQPFTVLFRQALTLASGTSGVEVIAEFGRGGKSRRIYFLLDKTVFGIDCEASVSDWPLLESAYDQIINSFTLNPGVEQRAQERTPPRSRRE